MGSRDINENTRELKYGRRGLPMSEATNRESGVQYRTMVKLLVPLGVSGIIMDPSEKMVLYPLRESVQQAIQV